VHQVTSITVTGDASPLTAGTTRALTATVNTTTGTASGFTVSWSDPTGVLAIADSTGQQATVRGEILGESGVVAQLGATQSQPFKIVTRPQLIELSPAAPSVNVGSTANVNAIAKDALGRLLTGSGFSGTYEWASSDAATASVAPVNPGSGTAVVSGHKGGTANVTATWRSQFGSGITLASAAAQVTVVASPPPVFPTTGLFVATFVSPTSYGLSFPPATDVGTPQANLKYDVYASTDPATLFSGAPRLTINGGASPITGTLDVSSFGGANPRWVIGVKARDSEEQASTGVTLTLQAEANPDPAQTVLFLAGPAIYSVGPSAAVRYHGAALDPAQLASTLERIGPRPGPNGSIGGLFIGDDGRQYLYHRTGSAVLTARGPAITTDRGGCAGTGLRPLIAAPATSNGAPALVYSV
ncbi:MAG: hypothetical protein ACK4N5_23580, partial [Myxococcales bacterium]